MSAITGLLQQAGYPDFPLDDDGFPQPGVVLRYFRENMLYTDPTDGKQKHWTQADLAKRLGVSEVTVRLMETKNTGLDSISRRRVVADILKIPPALLGLGSLGSLSGFLASSATTSTTLATTPSIESETVTLYKHAAVVYGEKHLTNTAQDSVLDIGQWIRRIKNDINKSSGNQRIELQDILWSFYDLSAKIYSDDLNQWSDALRYLNAEMEIAGLLNSDELRAASLYRSGQIHFAQRQYFAAKIDLEGAMKYAQGNQIDPQLKSAVLASAGLAFAIVEKDEKTRTYVQMLLNQSEAIVLNNKSTNAKYLKFDHGKYLLEHADVLIALKRPTKALEVLDDASEEIDSSLRRRHAYINVLQAESLMRLKRPQLDTATELLTGAFTIATSIKSEFTVGHIIRRYNELRQGPYGNSTDVVDLGLDLKEWRKKH